MLHQILLGYQIKVYDMGRLVETRNAYKILEYPQETDHFKDLRINGEIILEWV
jgi:hypothetical protein